MYVARFPPCVQSIFIQLIILLAVGPDNVWVSISFQGFVQNSQSTHLSFFRALRPLSSMAGYNINYVPVMGTWEGMTWVKFWQGDINVTTKKIPIAATREEARVGEQRGEGERGDGEEEEGVGWRMHAGEYTECNGWCTLPTKLFAQELDDIMAEPKHPMAGDWYLIELKMRERLVDFSPGPKLGGVSI